MRGEREWIPSVRDRLDPHSPPPPQRLGQLEQTHLHPVGEPVAFGVGALHGEQNVAPGNDAPLWDRLDFDGQVSLVFL